MRICILQVLILHSWSVSLNQNSYFFIDRSQKPIQPRFGWKPSLWTWKLSRKGLRDDTISWSKSFTCFLTRICRFLMDSIRKETKSTASSMEMNLTERKVKKKLRNKSLQISPKSRRLKCRNKAWLLLNTLPLVKSMISTMMKPMTMVKKVKRSTTKKMVKQKLVIRERGKMIARMVEKRERKNEWCSKEQVSRVKTVFRTKH